MKIEDVNKTVVEVEKLISSILEQIKQLSKSVDLLNETRRDNTQLLNDLQRDYEKEFVAVKKDIDELRRWTEKNGLAEIKPKIEVMAEKVSKVETALEKIGTRAWSVVPNISGAVVNVLLAAVVAFIVAKRTK